MDMTEVIVVGSGLAGLVVALRLLDAACHVTILEKDTKIGNGNSIKASSGINGVTDAASVPQFLQDTVASAGEAARPHLIEPLVNDSATALAWLRERLEVDLSATTQLGGHSASRTHRPSGPMPVGAEIMNKLRQAVIEVGGDRVTVVTNARVRALRTEGRVVTGVEYVHAETQEIHTVAASHVVLASGGYTADRELLALHRPELTGFPSTQGPFTTGDGLRLGGQVQAACVDLDKIQIHPTGFVDNKDPTNSSKFLAAEVLRGVGGLLLNQQGQRFCNELGRRDYVTEQILSLEPAYAQTKKWDASLPIPRAHLVLSSEAAAIACDHIKFYEWKGLLQKVQGYQGIADFIGCKVEQVQSTLEEYQQAAQAGVDEFGKTTFRGVPAQDIEKEDFYVGTVTPVLHYCMGGLAIDAEGRVMGQDGVPIPGLYACGEVSGGVHGDNRLAGNSLLECVVYGTIVSQNILRDIKA